MENILDRAVPYTPREPDKQEPGKPTLGPLKTLTHRELMLNQYKPLMYVIPGLLPEGLTILAGAPKIGKSWLALDLCLSVATGGTSITHEAVRQGEALYLALEDSERRLQSRFKMIQDEDMPGSGNLHLCTDCPRADEGGLLLLIEWLDAHPDCRLVVIDTLQIFRAQGRGNETYASDYAALRPIQQLAIGRGVAIVLIHHTRKQEASDPFNAISGTTAISGASDSMWVLARGRGEQDGILNITGRDVDGQELAMRFDKDACQWSVVGDARALVASDEEQEILDLAFEHTGPLTPAIVSRDLAISASAAKMRLTRMTEKGKLEKSERGKYILPAQSHTGSHKVTQSHTPSVTFESPSEQGFQAESHKVTPLPMPFPDTTSSASNSNNNKNINLSDNQNPLNGCDHVTLPVKPAPALDYKSHTPLVTMCDLVALEQSAGEPEGDYMTLTEGSLTI